jgi:hypothetical protein
LRDDIGDHILALHVDPAPPRISACSTLAAGMRSGCWKVIGLGGGPRHRPDIAAVRQTPRADGRVRKSPAGRDMSYGLASSKKLGGYTEIPCSVAAQAGMMQR